MLFRKTPGPEVMQPHLPEGIDYSQPNGCFSAAVAYIMYRLNAPPNLWQPSAIDNITDRGEGEITTGPTDEAYLALLDQGPKITDISSYDRDRLIQEGLAYLEEYHANGWLNEDPAGFYAHWTPENVEAEVQSTQNFRDQVGQYGENWQEELRDPTPEDFVSNLEPDQSKVILTHIRGGNIRQWDWLTLRHITKPDPSVSHSIVATDISEPARTGGVTHLTFFSPGEKPHFRSQQASTFFQKTFLPDSGITIVEVGA